jgi:pimeloyl-ACP methyl ester carboxylesterase
MTAAIYRSESAAAAVEALYRDVLDRWPVPKAELHLPTCRGRTFVLACGPKSAPPVLLLHGAQANSAAWLPDIALWASRFRLYAVDMIGEPGFSERREPPPCSLGSRPTRNRDRDLQLSSKGVIACRNRMRRHSNARPQPAPSS